MKKGRRILLAASLLAVAGLAWWQITREPHYHGRSLSAWLNDYGAGPKDYKPSPQTDEALRQIGSKAVPYLLRWLRETNNSYHTRITRKPPPPSTNMVQVLYLRIQQESVVPPKPWMKTVEKYTPFHVERTLIPASWSHWKAFLGFQALGPSGKSALPDLARLANDPSGNSIYPNIASMKDLKGVAGLAYSSSSYAFPGQSRVGDAFLVDGEIAAWSLAAIGPEAIPSLMELLANPNPRLQARAAEALGMAGVVAESAVPALVNKLKSPDLDVRIRAADALGWIGREPAFAIPALMDALQDRQMGVAYYAAESLGRFGERASNAVPALLVNFKSPDYRIRESAAIALSKISRESTDKEVLPVLLRQLKDPNYSWRATALITLQQMRIEPRVVIPAYIEALDDPDTLVRNNAAIFLGRFGPEAKAAVPKLIPLMNDTNVFVRQDASNALEKIDPSWKSGH